MISLQINGSTSTTPDLDWSQVRETVRLLNLAVAQIGQSMKEGDDSVERLGTSFAAMFSEIEAIRSIAGDERENGPDMLPMEKISQKSAALRSELEAMIVAFQFYDRVTQQLNHVSGNLKALSELVSDSAKIYNPLHWYRLQDEIRSKINMESQREVFDAVMDGAGIEEALDTVRIRGADHVDENDVEFF